MTHRIFRLVISLFLAVVMIAINLAPKPTRAAGPWYVAPGGNDSNNCLSPGTACLTINGALAKPGFIPGDTIRVAIGIYTGSGDEVLLLDKDTFLSGGWNSAFTSQSGMSTIDGENSRRGVSIYNIVTAILDRFIIQNGNTGGGGGIFNSSGNLTINNSSIQNNTTRFAWGGGGIYNNGTITVNNTTISGNISYIWGGAIDNDGTMTLNNTTISNNTASYNTFNWGGGGIDNEGILIINNSSIQNNSAAYGGGIKNYIHGSVILNSTSLSNNSVSDAGGGILNEVGTITLNTNTISNNSASYGGGIYNVSGILNLNNTTISSNIAGFTGGGLYNISGNASIDNSTISGNLATNGGGIADRNDTLKIQNTILAGNTASTGADCFEATEFPSVLINLGYNLIGNILDCDFASVTGDLININPLLGPLQDNGGLTFTHALLPGSPAIDAGNPAGCNDQNGNLLTTDQRGVARPQGTRCDIGAFELEADGGGAVEVTIDIKPGRFPNRIKLTSNVCNDDDNVYVALLTTPSFNARTVNASTLQLGDPKLSGKATPIKSRITDVDLDGDKDMVLRFSLCAIVTNGALNRSSIELVLTGGTLDGTNFTGRDSVKVVR